jgi:hypothetical protein
VGLFEMDDQGGSPWCDLRTLRHTSAELAGRFVRIAGTRQIIYLISHVAARCLCHRFESYTAHYCNILASVWCQNPEPHVTLHLVGSGMR